MDGPRLHLSAIKFGSRVLRTKSITKAFLTAYVTSWDPILQVTGKGPTTYKFTTSTNALKGPKTIFHSLLEKTIIFMDLKLITNTFINNSRELFFLMVVDGSNEWDPGRFTLTKSTFQNWIFRTQKKQRETTGDFCEATKHKRGGPRSVIFPNPDLFQSPPVFVGGFLLGKR